MKVAIIGYGKMGKEIEEILLQRGHEITLRSNAEKPFMSEDLADSDVAIEFSTPESVVDNIFKCFEANCPVVVGTTGWYNRLNELKSEVSSRNQSMMYASNFSIGVNLVFHINKLLAQAMDELEEYDSAILEIHHSAKLDKPSGTAITLAEGILDKLKRKTKWVNDVTTNPEELSVISQREGEVAGTHVVTYSSPVDHISLVHQAINRKGFALGAVKAAEWLKDKKGTFSMNDFLKF